MLAKLIYQSDLKSIDSIQKNMAIGKKINDELESGIDELIGQMIGDRMKLVYEENSEQTTIMEMRLKKKLEMFLTKYLEQKVFKKCS